jgi:hypothetical protein
MDHGSSQLSHPNLCSPYRVAPLQESPSPRPAAHTGLIMVCAFGALFCTLVTGMRSNATPLTPARHLERPDGFLDTAVRTFAERNRRPLYIARGLPYRALHRPVWPGSLNGPPEDTIRALNLYATESGLWFHEVDGILRLERLDASPQPRLEFSVSRNAIEHTLNQPAVTLNAMRVVPVVRDDHVAGLLIQYIPAESLPASLGVRNGDVLLRVNGTDFSSPDHCLQVYSRMQQTDRFILEIERNGLPMTLVYNIV